ncbi:MULTISPECIES: dienelactone hydrolase family protein [Niastella]|uniref:Dienelactone hydrolase family protein n=1 Tax=Niastella soli TaxID=2821487 RepID=A0ABS3YZW5_9BACT|nr:dienelactone hydrolase family protein [Niastella soli]MBO9203433.1 dienelactone hydrolase family protein [Niastella soli]
MKQKLGFAFLSLIIAAIVSCNDQSSKPATEQQPTETKQPGVKTLDVSYAGDNTTMKGYVAYDTSLDTKRPAILIIPEWWGLNDYTKMRARELAKLGYIAMAMDMYGNGVTTDSPAVAGKLAGQFYTKPLSAKARIEAAMVALKSFTETDTGKLAAIGYCFGGAMVLNAAKLGEPFKGVVSFHGNLAGVPANKDLLKAKVLVCHGEADPFVKPEEVAQFKKQMDSIKADYTFKSYPNALHAFTNPQATELGKKWNLPIAYNGAADTASWNDMKTFFDTIFK